VLRLLARLSPFDPDTRAQVVKVGLKSQHVEIRDAAMQAVENWGEAALIKSLRNHRDEVPWLKSYAGQILKDLS